MRSHDQIEPAGLRSRRCAECRKHRIRPAPVGRRVFDRFPAKIRVPGFVSQLDVNGAEGLRPRLASSAGRAQGSARRCRRTRQVFRQLPRLVQAHRRRRHDPRLRAHLPAQLKKLRNPHRNVVGRLEPRAVARPLARRGGAKKIVHRAAQSGVALHQPQHAGMQLLQRLHHFVAKRRMVRGVAVRSAPAPHRPAAPSRRKH